jgi:hypothetical protein
MAQFKVAIEARQVLMHPRPLDTHLVVFFSKTNTGRNDARPYPEASLHSSSTLLQGACCILLAKASGSNSNRASPTARNAAAGLGRQQLERNQSHIHLCTAVWPALISYTALSMHCCSAAAACGPVKPPAWAPYSPYSPARMLYMCMNTHTSGVNS